MIFEKLTERIKGDWSLNLLISILLLLQKVDTCTGFGENPDFQFLQFDSC